MENLVQLNPLLFRNIFTAGGFILLFTALCGLIRFFIGVYRRRKEEFQPEKSTEEKKHMPEKL